MPGAVPKAVAAKGAPTVVHPAHATNTNPNLTAGGPDWDERIRGRANMSEQIKLKGTGPVIREQG